MKKKQSLKQISLKKLTISKLTTPTSILGGTGNCGSGICGPGSTNIVCPSFPNRCPPPPSFNGSCSCNC